MVDADLIEAREIVKATLTPENHKHCNCRQEIDSGAWDAGQKVRAAAEGIRRGRLLSQPASDGEAMIIDAHLPSMTARFRIPEGLPMATGIYEIRRVRSPTDADQARWAHLEAPPADGFEEREAVVAWLDRWATIESTHNKDYAAGWTMCAFNAAREIERGDHVADAEEADG